MPISFKKPIELNPITFNVIFVRAGISCANMRAHMKMDYNGYIDPELTQKGIDNSEILKQTLTNKLIKFGNYDIYSSPLIRAWETAHYMTDTPIDIIPCVSEVNNLKYNVPLPYSDQLKIVNNIDPGISKRIQSDYRTPVPPVPVKYENSIVGLKKYLYDTFKEPPSIGTVSPKTHNIVIFTHSGYIKKAIDESGIKGGLKELLSDNSDDGQLRNNDAISVSWTIKDKSDYNKKLEKLTHLDIYSGTYDKYELFSCENKNDGCRTLPGFGKGSPCDKLKLNDTTLRSVIFGKYENVEKYEQSVENRQKFMKYEHALYICAQLSRIVYCDTGIIWNVMKDFGKNNDSVNKKITHYDKIYEKQRQTLVGKKDAKTGDPCDETIPLLMALGRNKETSNEEIKESAKKIATAREKNGEIIVQDDYLYESFELKKSDGSDPYGAYISTPTDCTVLIVKARGEILAPNSQFQSTDIFITFKGSSRKKDVELSIRSALTYDNLKNTIKNKLGINIKDVGNVRLSFIKPVISIINYIIRTVSEFATANCRLFVTGHGLGGGCAYIFGLIIGELRNAMKLNSTGPYATLIKPLLDIVQTVHIITFGAPPVFTNASRNAFNEHLKSRFMTLDRLYNSRDSISTSISSQFEHPGFNISRTTLLQKKSRQLIDSRPYTMKDIRNYYGFKSDTDGRSCDAWPFTDAICVTNPSIMLSKEDKNEFKELLELAEAEEVKKIQEEERQAAAGTAAGTAGTAGTAVLGGFILTQDAKRARNEKNKYASDVLLYMPNVIRYQCNKYVLFAPHSEYLGMTYFTAFRGSKIKNPATKYIAYFRLNKDGVNIQYLPNKMSGGSNTKKRKPKKNKTKKRNAYKSY